MTQRKKYDIEVYEGTDSDVEEIATLAERFFRESNFHNDLTLAPIGWRKTLYENIANPSARAIIAVDAAHGRIVGYVLIYKQRDYTVESVGELFQFYVSPEYRRTSVARSLIQAAVNQFDAWGCARCYAEASPGMAMGVGGSPSRV
jgi:ribosomal protein S18 acetylase RimI-like enzyme